MQESEKLHDNLLFGTSEEIVIKRNGKKCEVRIGNKSLFGVESIVLRIDAGKPLQYTISGEVVG